MRLVIINWIRFLAPSGANYNIFLAFLLRKQAAPWHQWRQGAKSRLGNIYTTAAFSAIGTRGAYVVDWH